MHRFSIYDFRFTILVVLLSGCAGEEMPRVGVECSTCHDYAALTAARGNDTDGPREWLGSASRGLAAQDSAFTGETEYALQWARRGRHPAFTLDSKTCYSCHPVSESGERHSLDAYPPGSADETGDCASACHLWLPSLIRSEGFGGAAYEGTARPYGMLTQVRTRHTDLLEKGYPAEKTPKPSVKVRLIAPGCAGCHAMNDPRHGAITTCTDCHAFAAPDAREASASKGLHELHLLFVKNGRGAAGLSGSNPSDCALCHRFEEDQTLSNAMCYNCHLSGHNPTTALWP